MSPLSKFPWKKMEAVVCMYVSAVQVCICAPVCVCVCAGKQGLNGKRKVDGERIREGSEGVRWPFNLESLMWMTHIWLPKMMDSATHAIWESDPSFFYLLPPSVSLTSSISSACYKLPPLTHASGPFLLPGSPIPSLSATIVAGEKIHPAHLMHHIFLLALNFNHVLQNFYRHF